MDVCFVSLFSLFHTHSPISPFSLLSSFLSYPSFYISYTLPLTPSSLCLSHSYSLKAAVKMVDIPSLAISFQSVANFDVLKKNFQREIEILSRLKHRNVVHLIGMEEKGSLMCRGESEEKEREREIKGLREYAKIKRRAK